jgi:stage II sporulation protein D
MRGSGSALLLVTLLGPHAVPGPAAAAVSYPVPPAGAILIVGHGWGHGHGMSQYGARGGALAGGSATAILNFYYPYSVPARVNPAAPIRVRLTGAVPTQLVVRGVPGLVATDRPTGRVLRMTDPRPHYRVVINQVAMAVQYTRDGRTWATLRWPGAEAQVPGPVTVAASGGALWLAQHGGRWREYEGRLTAVRQGPAEFATVNTAPLDRYLAGVLGREMPASWPVAALRAQAVAARTYAAFERAHAGPARGWDTCDSAGCQVYGGRRLLVGNTVTALQPPSVLAAVRTTAGQIRAYRGGPILAQYSASDGGFSAPGGYPYLMGRADPYDRIGNPRATWRHPVRAAALAVCAHLRTVTALTVLGRDGAGEWGGRLTAVRLTGTAANGAGASRDLTAGQLRSCLPAVFWSTYATVG